MEKFEYAVRNKFRYPYKGGLTTEDLWDLPVGELDKVYKVLNSEIKELSEESLLEKKTQKDKDLEIMVDIVKHVFDAKMEERENKKKQAEVKERKQILLSILADKEKEELTSYSADDIRKMLADLD